MPAAFYWLVGCCSVLSAVYSLPIDDNAIGYLRSYGYLPTTISTRFGDDIIHEDTAMNALKALQRIGNIKETGVLDDATKALLRKPRCGNPDFEITQNQNLTRRRREKRYALGPTKWEKSELTWKFMNRNHPRSRKEYDQIVSLINEALDIWEFNSNLTFHEVREDADILIDFARLNHGDNFSFQGPGGSLAHAFYPSSGLGGDVHLDDDESWDIENGVEGDVSFFYTLLHELGHSLGLGHSSTTESIMYPWYSSSRTFDRKAKELYEDDIWAIQELYGKKGRSWGPISTHKTTRRITMTPRPRVTRPTTGARSTTTEHPKPDKCNTSYDAIGIIRNELMIFKGIWMWRFRHGNLLQGYPVEFHRMWNDLQSFDHIDAVFERRDGKFVFFNEKEVMVIDSSQRAYKHDLAYLGFSPSVKKIDAIFRWGYNNKTYVFSGDDFWKVDDELRVDHDEKHEYPRKIAAVWRRVKSIKMDTAFQKDGITYFFSNKMFYKFNDNKMSLDVDKPLVSSQFWMDCQYTEEEITSIQKSARVQNEEDISTSSTTSTATVSVFTLWLTLSSFSFHRKLLHV